MSGGFLKLPRVRVFWGDINLTAYTGGKGAPEVFTAKGDKGAPLVYDIRTSLASEGEGPTAEFKWDPTGPGFAVYEWFLSQEKYVQGKISIEFFYAGGKKIVMFYKWSGQTINYGNDMSVTVKLQSELAGLVNSNQRNTAQAYDEKKGAKLTDVLDKTTKQFGLEKNENILTYNEYTEKLMKDVKLLTVYGNDQTYGAAISNLTKQAGLQTTANNIGNSGLVSFAPYSWKGEKGQEQIKNGATDIGAGEAPEAKERYGYLLGPSIINSTTRTYNWKPPQQDNSPTPSSQTRAERPRDEETGQFITYQEAARRQTAKKTSSPLGTANARPNPGVQNKDNPNGPDRQNALNAEKSQDLTFDTFMCPLLVGLKPNDIVFIPSLKGDVIEDWIVQNVDYSQSNGAVNISVKATRTFGVKETMNEKMTKKFLEFAKKQKLVGPDATLEAWDSYAWGLPGGESTPAAADPTKTSNNSVLQQQAQELRDMQEASRRRQAI